MKRTIWTAPFLLALMFLGSHCGGPSAVHQGGGVSEHQTVIGVSAQAVMAASADKSGAKQFGRRAVMAPLFVSDWRVFSDQLAAVKAVGVTSVSTDVWWGLVEGEQDQHFDWSYYDQVSAVVFEAGLKWVPILSFHKCGGNVGDDCNCRPKTDGTCQIPIPEWLWNTLGGARPDSLKYKSEKGNLSDEVIALWSDDAAGKQYEEFMLAFAAHFGDRAGSIDEINISAGPSGELRYPSYNAHDDFSYPARGFLQAYSDTARADFAEYTKEKYRTLDAVNRAWQSQLKGWNEVQPPSDAPGFFNRRDYLDIQYGKDFTSWYNGALIAHGKFMIDLAEKSFGNDFRIIPIGIKIPGVHWQMSSPTIPRSAEISAGLINGDTQLHSDETAHGYSDILDMLVEENAGDRRVILHFTCLEMNNSPAPDNYSLAKDLVFWVGNGAGARGVVIMGENALSGGITSDAGWDNIDNAVRWSAYQGLTTLRIDDLFSENGLGLRRYQKLIGEFANP